MNKQNLIDHIAANADISKAAASKAIDAFTDAITQAMKKEETVSLVGFGSFAVKQRAAREGRNPKTGQTLKIPASKSVGFKAGKGLKDACV